MRRGRNRGRKRGTGQVGGHHEVGVGDHPASPGISAARGEPKESQHGAALLGKPRPRLWLERMEPAVDADVGEVAATAALTGRGHGGAWTVEAGVRRDIGLAIVSGSRDRKSTRLNSSHRCISYAVFCL